jgi:hypothetical protein
MAGYEILLHMKCTKKAKIKGKLLNNKWKTNYETAHKRFINLSNSEELKV